jgi:hypothetical protein
MIHCFLNRITITIHIVDTPSDSYAQANAMYVATKMKQYDLLIVGSIRTCLLSQISYFSRPCLTQHLEYAILHNLKIRVDLEIGICFDFQWKFSYTVLHFCFESIVIFSLFEDIRRNKYHNILILIYSCIRKLDNIVSI